ncbi:MAG: IclR family transcriptional regulator [Proteobacteria bacterium]|nr:IclR family transcriptional regulator [Pseudomonadota bacterium]
MTAKPKYRAPALDKGLDILELLARTQGPLSMTEIAGGVGYSKGEIFRMLQVLEERNYITRNGNDVGYTLTNRLFMLGMEQPQNKSLVEAALPVMHRLADETFHPCHLVVASEEQIVVIARVDAPSDLGFVVRIGHRRPLAHSNSGLVLFAFQNHAVRERWLALLDASDPSFRKKNFIDRADLVRQQGYSTQPSEAVEGIIDLSAPVLVRGQAVGALTIPFIDTHPPRVSMKRAADKLREAVADISANMH